MNYYHQLQPDETMAQYRRRRRFETRCAAVASVIRQRPGIGSKEEIAAETGFDPDQVAKCLRALQRNEVNTPGNKWTRFDYGEARAKSGPWAGQIVVGWFPMDVPDYQHAMDQADWHSSRVEAGVRWSRLLRILYAQGCTTKQAQAIIAEVEVRMAVPVDRLTPQEAKAFERLATKQAIQVIKMDGEL